MSCKHLTYVWSPTILLNIVVEWLVLVLRNWEGLGLFLSLEDGYPDGGFLWP